MQILSLLGKLEINKLHVFLSPKADILHQRLQNDFCAAITRHELSSDCRVEYLGLFNASSDVQEFDQRLEIFYRIDTSNKSV